MAAGPRSGHRGGEPVPLLEIDLTALPPAERSGALDTAMERLQSGLDLARGPLFTAALFRLVEEDRLLLTAHHLVVDVVSWRVLLEDLAAAYRAGRAAGEDHLLEALGGAPGCPCRLGRAGGGDPLLALPEARAAAAGRPRRRWQGRHGERRGRARSRGDARRSSRRRREAYRTQVNDLLLAALVRAFAAWTGEGMLEIDLEGHGREEIFPGVDLSRTVGWFTTLFPVALSLPPGGGPREAIQETKETLRAVPRRGLGYGLLRYLAAAETGERLAALPAPQVSFNYLGRFDPAMGEGGLFAFAPEAPRGAGGEITPGRHLFAVDALVLGDRLRINWTYDPSRHLPATAERLARGFLAEIAALIAHCLSPEAGGFTPSDFPLAGLDQAALDRVVGNDRGVEDLYPLAPMQQGMLFHSLYTAGADLYVEQLTAELAGPFDQAAFIAAWRRVVERHGALRTGFLWQEVEPPLQLVRRQAELPWTAEDWRGLPPAALESRWLESPGRRSRARLRPRPAASPADHPGARGRGGAPAGLELPSPALRRLVLPAPPVRGLRALRGGGRRPGGAAAAAAAPLPRLHRLAGGAGPGRGRALLAADARRLHGAHPGAVRPSGRPRRSGRQPRRRLL